MVKRRHSSAKVNDLVYLYLTVRKIEKELHIVDLIIIFSESIPYNAVGLTQEALWKCTQLCSVHLESREGPECHPEARDQWPFPF